MRFVGGLDAAAEDAGLPWLFFLVGICLSFHWVVNK
jgi:hypothetical protein